MPMQVRVFLFKSLTISLIIGLTIGVISMFLAWQHNPQCAYHCEELGTDFGALAAVGFLWATVASSISFVIGGLINLIYSWAVKRHA